MRCVAVEDSATGVAAARAAGTFVVGVGARVTEAHVDLRVEALDDIPVERWLVDPAERADLP